MTALLRKQNREPAASGSSIEYGADAIKTFQQFPLDMILLNNIINISGFPAAFQFTLVREISLPFRNLLTVIHMFLLCQLSLQ